MTDELVSVSKVAAFLDCSPKTVRDWMYKNRRVPSSDPIPYYRLGGLVRFRLSDVTAWINRRRVRIGALSIASAPTRSPDLRSHR